jgi:arylsulfatase A
MNRRNFLKSLGAAAAASLVGPGLSSLGRAFASPGSNLNIVLILADDLGWGDVRCYGLEYGNDYFETPNIDRLRSEGMKFTDAYSPCAVCSPSRAAILTGRYTPRSGVTNWIGSSNPTNREMLCPANASQMPLAEVTIAEVLRPHGYATCHVGKWHLGTTNYFPDRQGFDHNLGGLHWGQPKGPKPQYFSPYGMATLPDGPEGEYLTDREGQEAVNFIQNSYDSGYPFFLYMSHYAIHNPFQAKDETIAKYESKPKPADPAYGHIQPVYAAMIEILDDAVGGILDKLDELGIADNTVVIFTSDNGGRQNHTVNGPFRGGKTWLWEGGTRVPLIVRWPGVVEPNSLSEEPVIGVDFLPTFCDMAGVPLPAGVEIDGISIVPVLKQQGPLGRDSLFWHYPHYNNDIPGSIIRCGKWKLIKRYGGDKEFELFDLENDISETTDLAPDIPEKVREFNEKLAAWLRRTGAKLPVKNPGYNHPAESVNVQIG